jgi:ubiquinone biosynthesis protein UbiJ
VAAKSSAPDTTAEADIATLRAEVARLAAETDALRSIVTRLARKLGE